MHRHLISDVTSPSIMPPPRSPSSRRNSLACCQREFWPQPERWAGVPMVVEGDVTLLRRRGEDGASSPPPNLSPKLSPDVELALFPTSELDYRIWLAVGRVTTFYYVALAPIEPLAESSSNRISCGAPLGLGRRRPQNKIAPQAETSGSIPGSHLMASQRRISWWPGGYGPQGRMGG